MASKPVERPWSERKFELALRRTRINQSSKAGRGAYLHLVKGYSVRKSAGMVHGAYAGIYRAQVKLREVDAALNH